MVRSTPGVWLSFRAGGAGTCPQRLAYRPEQFADDPHGLVPIGNRQSAEAQDL